MNRAANCGCRQFARTYMYIQQGEGMGLLEERPGPPCVISVMTVSCICLVKYLPAAAAAAAGIARISQLSSSCRSGGTILKGNGCTVYHRTYHTWAGHSPPDRLGNTPCRAGSLRPSASDYNVYLPPSPPPCLTGYIKTIKKFTLRKLVWKQALLYFYVSKRRSKQLAGVPLSMLLAPWQ